MTRRQLASMSINDFISGDVVDELVGPLLLVAADGVILDANLAALECYGYSASEMPGLAMSDIQAPSVGRDIGGSAGWRTAESVAVFEEEHRRKGGGLFPVEVRLVRVNANGEAAYLGFVVDITDRRHVESALRESEARHSAMIANISDVIGIMGVDGFMKYKSPNIGKCFGWHPDDLIGTDGWLTVHPDDVERLQREFFALLQEEGSARTVEYRYRCKDGSYKWIELTATNTVNDPAIGGVLLNYHDISVRKRVEQLGRELTSVIDVIGKVSEMRDPYTAGHQRRVSELATAIATDMGLPESEVEDIRVAGLIHDIGKMSVPAELLAKPTTLSPAEFSLIASHAEAGHSIIASANMPGPIAELVFQHHERCDGSGYPRGLVEEALLLGAKVLMVADVVEAMMSHRPYRAALGVEAALAEIELGAGTLFDVQVTESCARVFREDGFVFSLE